MPNRRDDMQVEWTRLHHLFSRVEHRCPTLEDLARSSTASRVCSVCVVCSWSVVCGVRVRVCTVCGVLLRGAVCECVVHMRARGAAERPGVCVAAGQSDGPGAAARVWPSVHAQAAVAAGVLCSHHCRRCRHRCRYSACSVRFVRFPVSFSVSGSTPPSRTSAVAFFDSPFLARRFLLPPSSIKSFTVAPPPAARNI